VVGRKKGPAAPSQRSQSWQFIFGFVASAAEVAAVGAAASVILVVWGVGVILVVWGIGRLVVWGAGAFWIATGSADKGSALAVEDQLAVLRELGLGEVAGGLGHQADSLDVVLVATDAQRDVLQVGPAATVLDAGLDDGEVVDLHWLTAEHLVSDDGHHVLQDADDASLGEAYVVLLDKLGELVDANRRQVVNSGVVVAYGAHFLVLIL